MSAPDSNVTTPDQGPAVGVIETDVFCEKCGFNLHTQRVWKDDRLGIFVCRCPECGGHSAAGKSISVTSPWLQRLSTGLMLTYVAVCVAFVIGFFFSNLGIYAAADEGLIYRTVITDTGQPVRIGNIQNASGGYQQIWVLDDTDPDNSDPYGMNIAPGATTIPTNRIREVATLAPWLRGLGDPRRTNYYYSYVPMWPALLITGIFVAGLFAFGIILAAGSWHWRRHRQYLWILVPILAFIAAMVMSGTERPQYSRWGAMAAADARPLQVRVFAVVLLLQIVILTIAIRFGRPMLRILLLVFIPPKARQLFAFLWHCDGKTMPVARPKYES